MTPSPGFQPFHILLAEDDDGDAKAIQRAFQRARIANPIHRALDGVEALDMLRGSNGKARVPVPRIVITDLNMPKMNGIQLIQAMRADQRADLRASIVFVLTTSARREDFAACAGAVAGYIVKAKAGLDFQELTKSLAACGSLLELPGGGGAALLCPVS